MSFCCHRPEHPAWLYKKQGKYEEAEPLHRRALGIMEKSLGAESPEYCDCPKQPERSDRTWIIPGTAHKDINASEQDVYLRRDIFSIVKGLIF